MRNKLPRNLGPGNMRHPNGELMVNQGTMNGWSISWNPDDERFYVHLPDGDVVATFAEVRNMRQYARTHAVTDKVTS